LTKRNDLELVTGLLNQWFWCDFIFDSKFEVFWAVLGVLEGSKCKNKATFVPRTIDSLFLKLAFFHFDHSKPLKQPKTTKF